MILARGRSRVNARHNYLPTIHPEAELDVRLDCSAAAAVAAAAAIQWDLRCLHHPC